MGTQAAVLRSPTDEEIQDALNRILSSAAFRASKRCKDFTEYVCLKTLEGAGATLKERTLAIDVFNRHTHGEDSGDENIVRVGAREVRKRLAIYYGIEGPFGILPSYPRRRCWSCLIRWFTNHHRGPTP